MALTPHTHTPHTLRAALHPTPPYPFPILPSSPSRAFPVRFPPASILVQNYTFALGDIPSFRTSLMEELDKFEELHQVSTPTRTCTTSGCCCGCVHTPQGAAGDSKARTEPLLAATPTSLPPWAVCQYPLISR